MFNKNENHLIGYFIIHVRWIRLKHRSPYSSTFLFQVDENQTLRQIAQKLLKYNSHCFSYVCRYGNRILDFDKTAPDNGFSNDKKFYRRVA